jgi:hypothetical protein
MSAFGRKSEALNSKSETMEFKGVLFEKTNPILKGQIGVRAY